MTTWQDWKGERLFKNNQTKHIYIYILLEPNDPCFDWKRPCFGGLTFKNKGYLVYIIHINGMKKQ